MYCSPQLPALLPPAQPLIIQERGIPHSTFRHSTASPVTPDLLLRTDVSTQLLLTLHRLHCLVLSIPLIAYDNHRGLFSIPCHFITTCWHTTPHYITSLLSILTFISLSQTLCSIHASVTCAQPHRGLI
jgi:hypothetical protein